MEKQKLMEHVWEKDTDYRLLSIMNRIPLILNHSFKKKVLTSKQSSVIMMGMVSLTMPDRVPLFQGNNRFWREGENHGITGRARM